MDEFPERIFRELDQKAEENWQREWRAMGRKRVMGKQWDCDDVARWLVDNSFPVEMDNERQIVAYTGLYEAPDGSLWAENSP